MNRNLKHKLSYLYLTFSLLLLSLSYLNTASQTQATYYCNEGVMYSRTQQIYECQTDPANGEQCVYQGTQTSSGVCHMYGYDCCAFLVEDLKCRVVDGECSYTGGQTYCQNCWIYSGEPTEGPTPTGTTLIPTPISEDCGCCETGDWDEVNGCFERNGEPGLQCCCASHCLKSSDGSCLSDSVRCPDTDFDTPVCGYIWDSETGEGIPNITVRFQRENSKEQLLTTDAFGHFRTDDGYNPGWGLYDSYSVQPLTDSIPEGYQGLFKTTTHPHLVDPGQTEVPMSVRVYQGDPDDAPAWHGTNTPVGIDSYYGQTVNWMDNIDGDGPACTEGEQSTSELDDKLCRCNFQLDPINRPQVKNLTLIEPTDNSACVDETKTETVVIKAEFFDDNWEPGFNSLIDNGSFEKDTTEGWAIYADQNVESQNFYLSPTTKMFNNKSIAIEKGADSGSWGPHITHALPTLTIGQTYTVSVGIKAPTAGYLAVQRVPSSTSCLNYPTLARADSEGGNYWQTLRLTFTPENECERHAQIVLSTGTTSTGHSEIGDIVYFDGLAVVEGDQTGLYSDIDLFQVNLEDQTLDDPDGNGLHDYQAGRWPIRIFVTRHDHLAAGTADTFELFHAPTSNWSSAPIEYHPETGWYYLGSDITVTNDSGATVATLLASTPGPIGSEGWQTYFYPESDGITANFALDLASGFPSSNPAGISNFHINGNVSDYDNNQDNRTAVGDGRQTIQVFWNNGASSDYWHRLDTLNTIQPNIDFNIWEGDSCSSSPVTPVTVNHAKIELEGSFSDYFDGSSFSMTPNSCEGPYNVALDLTSQTGSTYVCGCDNGVDGNSFTCEYFDVEATDETGNSINFFVQQADLSHGPWFQSVGGNILASGEIRSYVPYNSTDNGPCTSAVSCEPALLTSLPWSSGNTDTPGFPLAAGSVDTIDGDGQYSNIHNGNRSQSDNGRAENLTAQLPQRGYTYYYNKFGFNGKILSNSTMPTGLSTSDLNVYQYSGNLTISDTNSWNVSSDVKLVVFVDGNLTFSGSDSNITSVEPGGFLAFIVSGDIIIDESVGHSMSSSVAESASNLPNTATSNLEGVFIAQKITVESAGSSAIDNKLIAEGTFVGWNGITLARNFANEGGVGATHNMYNPTETFIHRPDLVINMPVEMKEALHEWREVNPSKE